MSFNVKCAMFDMMSRSVVSATSDVASELPTDEQVVCQDLTGESRQFRAIETSCLRTSVDGFDICTVLCDGCEMQTGTSRNLTVRTNWEFEIYVNIEILEVIYIVTCQTEEGLVRAHGSIPCGCVKDQRDRRWLSRIRAWTEEYDVCSSLPQSLSVADESWNVKDGMWR